MLDRFNRWFASAPGVWQTLAFVLGWIVLEKLRVIPDPDGFQLLYWLTVYSAVTQPALAYVARKSGDHQDRQSAALLAILEHIEMHEPCDCAPLASREADAARDQGLQ